MSGWVGSCQITKNAINHDLIKIIQVCLKIYNLWRFPLPMGGHMGQWVDGWGHVKSLKSNLEVTEII